VLIDPNAFGTHQAQLHRIHPETIHHPVVYPQ